MKTKFKDILNENGLKATKQRILIFEILTECEEHPSAEYILREFKKRGEHIALATVYNILETFSRHNLVDMFYYNNDVMRFDAKTDFHIHLCHSATSEIEDFCEEGICAFIEEYLTENFKDYGKIKKIELKLHLDSD